MRTLGRWGLIALFALAACSSGGSTPFGVTLSGPPELGVGETVQFVAKSINPADTAFDWESDDQAVALVDANGNVTGIGIGEAVIRATGRATGASDQTTVSVDFDPSKDVPFYDDWKMSGHSDPESPAFKRFEDGVSASCAKCHSRFGFQDFLGEDGSTPGEVNSNHPGGSVVDCVTCHNNASLEWDAVKFPSGSVISGLGREATCMECHQGRRSMDDVDSAIAGNAPANDDTVMPGQRAVDIHYKPGAATRYGSAVRAGYQYEGKSYDVLWRHVDGASTCQECHDPHSTKIRLDLCATCHSGVTEASDTYDIRMMSSFPNDYDGDGNRNEGIFYELQGVQAALLDTIREYARETVGQPIAYKDGKWFEDENDNGDVDDNETTQYTSFTPRLLKATYNYRYQRADHGGYAHNAKYFFQLANDSIADLNGGLSNPLPFGGDRDDLGHFNGTATAFRNWDGGDVPASCAKCHSASDGFTEFLTYGSNTAQDVANGFDCSECHTTLDTFEVRFVETVTFPSGYTTPPATGGTSDPATQSNLCMTCHQGRTSKVQIDEAIANNELRFQNIHYLAAAATLMGNLAQSGYEYDGKAYAGRWPHSTTATNNNCTDCHDAFKTTHTFNVQDNIAYCRQCHVGIETVFDVRVGSDEDYNGNGDTTEPLRDELAPIADALLAEIKTVAEAAENPICYRAHDYPYWFKDTNGNGVCDPDEINYGNRFTAWTPALIKAAHNFQQSQEEPGAWAHNFAYITQLVIDSIEDLGGDIEDYIRP